MTLFERRQAELKKEPKTWLITGVAGFIGSNLLEYLLRLDQRVVGLDNFSTGFQANLDEVESLVSVKQWSRFTFMEGDVRVFSDCRKALSLDKYPIDYVLHQAALGSVPRSISDPVATNETNITGHLNMLIVARDAKVKSFVYAASSSTYGDHPALPKVEDTIGNPLSPYAVTKLVNELYANVFFDTYGFKATGLRYFNVFGPRQNPDGAYAAVIPKWTGAMINGDVVHINGDGETSRDFCFIDNAIQANILAALASEEAKGEIYNVAVNARTTLNQLFCYIKEALESKNIEYSRLAKHRDFRPGDVRHSEADITKAATRLGYVPTHTVTDGIQEAMSWYIGYFSDKEK